MLLFNLAPAAICASSELNSAPTSLCYLTPIVGEERYRIDQQQFTLWPVHDSNYDIRVARAHSSPTINAGARNCGGTKSMKICFRRWSTWRTQSLRSFVQSPSPFLRSACAGSRGLVSRDASSAISRPIRAGFSSFDMNTYFFAKAMQNPVSNRSMSVRQYFPDCVEGHFSSERTQPFRHQLCRMYVRYRTEVQAWQSHRL